MARAVRGDALLELRAMCDAEDAHSESAHPVLLVEDVRRVLDTVPDALTTDAPADTDEAAQGATP